MIETPRQRDTFEFMLEEKHEYGADDVVILDLDRTSLQSDNLSGYVYQIVRREHPGQVDVINKIAAEEEAQKGNAYEYLRLLEKHGISVDPDRLARQVMDEHRDEHGALLPEFVAAVLVDGADEYVRKVTECGATIVLHTAGDSLTQLFKIRLMQALLRELAEVEVESYIITDESGVSKTVQLEKLYDSDAQKFQFSDTLAAQTPEIRKHHFSEQLKTRLFARLTLLDDKTKHHEGNLGLLSIRHALVVASGMPDDGELRLTITSLADKVVVPNS